MRVGINNAQRMSGCAPIKLYLQKQSRAWVWPVGYSFMTTDTQQAEEKVISTLEWLTEVLHCRFLKTEPAVTCLR